MKREDVKQHIPSITDEQLDWLMTENGSDITREKEKAATVTAERDSLQTRLTEASGKLEGYDPEWKAKVAQAQADADAKIAGMKFDTALDSAINEAKGRSTKAVRAMLDLDALRGSQNQAADIKAALEAVKKNSAYLFESGSTPPPYSGGTGTDPIPGAQARSLVGALREKYNV